MLHTGRSSSVQQKHTRDMSAYSSDLRHNTVVTDLESFQMGSHSLPREQRMTELSAAFLPSSRQSFSRFLDSEHLEGIQESIDE